MDSRTQRSGRSPSVSPDRGSTPTSPYSVPQIAPLPSSTLCPICKTSDLTSTPSQPNFNTCTQCHSKVCNQCGFNPNPHLTQVSTAAPSPPACPAPSRSLPLCHQLSLPLMSLGHRPLCLPGLVFWLQMWQQRPRPGPGPVGSHPLEVWAAPELRPFSPGPSLT